MVLFWTAQGSGQFISGGQSRATKQRAVLAVDCGFGI